MENNQTLPLRSKISYALGAVGKDMVYMLSASYVLYYSILCRLLIQPI